MRQEQYAYMQKCVHVKEKNPLILSDSITFFLGQLSLLPISSTENHFYKLTFAVQNMEKKLFEMFFLLTQFSEEKKVEVELCCSCLCVSAKCFWVACFWNVCLCLG